MANEDAGRNKKVTATEPQGRARAAGARKPGVVANLMERCRETVQSIRLPRPDWRTFAWGLLLLIMIVLIVRNWAPVRINVFGWYLDAPKAVVFAVIFALGMVTSWLLEMRHRRARPARRAEEAAVEAIDERATPIDYEDEVVAAEEAPGELPLDAEESAEADPIEEDQPVAAEDEPEPDATPEQFAPLADAGESADAEEDVIEVPQDFAPAAASDDAAGDEITFDEPADDPDALRSLDADVDADLELEDAGNNGDEATDDADDEDDGKPFWRL